MSNNTRLAELMNYITIDTTSGNQFQMSGSIKQTSVTSALLKANATGVLTAATAGTDYLTSVGISNLTATGTPDSTTYLRGDNTWAAVSGGGSGVTLDTTQTITGQKTFQGNASTEGAVLGSELAAVTATATNWALAGTNLNVGGYTHTAGSTTFLVTSLALSIDTKYIFSATLSGWVAGNVTIRVSGQYAGGLSYNATVNTILTATSTAALQLEPSINFNGTVTVSIKAIVSSGSAIASFTTSSGASIFEVRGNASNSFFGVNSGRNSVLGSGSGVFGAKNTAFGISSGEELVGGYNNTFFGYLSGQKVVDGTHNTFFGTSSGQRITSGYSNTFLGALAGEALTFGGYNTFVGDHAGDLFQAAYDNTAVGAYALGGGYGANITSGSNTAVGAYALNKVGSGSNTGVGYYAGYSLFTGSNNTLLGYQAGRYISNGSTAVTTSNNSLFLGYQTYPLADSQTNQIVIGYNVVGLGSNTTVLGNSSTTDTAIYGNLLLGSTTTGAGFKLNVTGLSKFTGTIASNTAPLSAELATVTGTGTNWALAGTNLNVGGYTHTAGSTVPFTTSLAAVAGTNYLVSYILTGNTAGSVTLDFGGATRNISSSSGTYYVLSPATSSALILTPTTTFDGTLTVSLKSVGASSASVIFANSLGNASIEVRPSDIVTNLFIGVDAGKSNYNGDVNTFVGNSAGTYNIKGFQNSFFGYFAGYNNTIGTSNTYIGHTSGRNTTSGYENSALGYHSGYNITGGYSNTLIGNDSMYYLSTGTQNTALGSYAGQGSGTLTGGNNIYIGAYAAFGVAGSSANNTIIGTNSARALAGGSNNTFLGFTSGRYISGGSVSATATDNSIFLGYQAYPLANTQTNQIVIGYATVGLGSNTTVIGNSSTTLTALYGTVITGGTSANAAAQLQVDSTTKGVLFPRMTTTQKNAIATPPEGLVVYDTDLAKLCVRTASAWQTITSA